jgi:hypothetical protein
MVFPNEDVVSVVFQPDEDRETNRSVVDRFARRVSWYVNGDPAGSDSRSVNDVDFPGVDIVRCNGYEALLLIRHVFALSD